MKFFLFISIFSALMLFGSKPFNQKEKAPKRVLPEFITDMHRDFKDQFQYPQNANILWAFMTGEKRGISPKILKSFNKLEIGFFFSPSGIHLSGFLAMIFYLLKKIKNKNKKITRITKWIFLIAAFSLPYLAIKRIVILRILYLSQMFLKKRISIEILFLLTFLISFGLGHFSESPLGFILSFLYMGTFIALRDQSRSTIILGLFSSHLLIAFFSGSEVSLVSLLLNLPLIAIFAFLLPAFYFYFLTFQWIDFNWIELIVRIFILSVHWTAKLTNGTLVSSTVFLIMAAWIILLKKQKRYLVLFLLLHGNVAISPAFFYSGAYPVGQRAFVYK